MSSFDKCIDKPHLSKGNGREGNLSKGKYGPSVGNVKPFVLPRGRIRVDFCTTLQTGDVSSFRITLQLYNNMEN